MSLNSNLSELELNDSICNCSSVIHSKIDCNGGHN